MQLLTPASAAGRERTGAGGDGALRTTHKHYTACLYTTKFTCSARWRPH